MVWCDEWSVRCVFGEVFGVDWVGCEGGCVVVVFCCCCCMCSMLMCLCGVCVKVECGGDEEGVWCGVFGVFVVGVIEGNVGG